MIIVWHHRDLRIDDNLALIHACEEGETILPLFIFDPEGEGDWAIGSAARWWLHQSLNALHEAYRDKDSGLAVRKGKAEKVFQEIIDEHSVEKVVWVERFEPAIKKRDEKMIAFLKDQGIDAEIVPGDILLQPDSLKTNEGKPYEVFTPFYKALKKVGGVPKPKHVRKLPNRARVPMGKVEGLGLVPDNPWYEKIAEEWEPGIEGAKKKLNTFIKKKLSDYQKIRDFPAIDGTSLLSPHLHFGEISIRDVWHQAAEEEKSEPFLSELVWREFSYHFLYHHKNFPDTTWREKFRDFPWKENQEALERWQKGMTGYPIVDAGMRQLWQTGWMHNRVRMIVGSFLIKDLNIHWIEGAKWFWDTLVDADLANNSMGWQWVSGGGPDGAPYFRIFNPILQGKKFDADGEYIRRYVHELKDFPTEYIHAPWEAPELIALEGGVVIGRNYPAPMVDHKQARDRALEAYNEIK